MDVGVCVELVSLLAHNWSADVDDDLHSAPASRNACLTSAHPFDRTSLSRSSTYISHGSNISASVAQSSSEPGSCLLVSNVDAGPFYRNCYQAVLNAE